MKTHCWSCGTDLPVEPSTKTSPCAHVTSAGRYCRLGSFTRDAVISREYIFDDLFKPEPQLWAPEFL